MTTQIKEAMVLSLMSIRTKLQNQFSKVKNSFELYGFDFILDTELRPWLIEINTNPCIEESSQLLKNLLPRIINDMFKITIDAIHPTKFEDTPEVYPFDNYADDEQIWEEIYDIGEDKVSNINKEECLTKILDI